MKCKFSMHVRMYSGRPHQWTTILKLQQGLTVQNIYVQIMSSSLVWRIKSAE